MHISVGIILAIVGAVIGAVVGYLFRQQRYRNEMGNLEAMRTRLLEEAEKQARDIVLNSKDEAIKFRQDIESELDGRTEKLRREEDRLQQRRDKLDSRQERIDRREQQLNKRQSTMDKRWNELQKLSEQHKQQP